jgi:hypothetical protein
MKSIAASLKVRDFLSYTTLGQSLLFQPRIMTRSANSNRSLPSFGSSGERHCELYTTVKTHLNSEENR